MLALQELQLLHHDLPRNDNISRIILVDPSTGYVQYEEVAGIVLEDAIICFKGDYTSRLLYTRPIAAGVARGLAHLHSNGVVHRNVVPENIMLCAGSAPKIGGFDCCAIGTDPRIHTLIGTPEYMAPEMIKAHQSSTTVDWWAFGCLLHEMLLGESPFAQNADAASLIKHILYSQITLDRLEPSEKHIISWFLTRDPTQRLCNIAALSHPWFSNTQSPVSVTELAALG